MRANDIYLFGCTGWIIGCIPDASAKVCLAGFLIWNIFFALWVVYMKYVAQPPAIIPKPCLGPPVDITLYSTDDLDFLYWYGTLDWARRNTEEAIPHDDSRHCDCEGCHDTLFYLDRPDVVQRQTFKPRLPDPGQQRRI